MYINHCLSKLIGLGLVAGFLGPLSAAEFIVNDVSDAPDADLEDQACLTESGSCTLRAAIEQANRLLGTDRITLPAGTYELTAGKPLNITSNLVVAGAGADRVVVDGGSNSGVFRISNGASVTISGVTIRGGNADYGGAIGVWGGARFSLAESIIEENVASKGGGIYVSVSRVTIESTTFSGNRANGSGGAIHVIGRSSDLSIYDSRLENNSSSMGGGIYCGTADTVQVERVRFIKNVATGYDRVAGGGGIYNRYCSIMMNEVRFEENQAEKRGGALFNGSGGRLDVVAASFTGNRAVKEDGGAIYSSGTMRIQRASLIGNQANYGAALYDAGKTVLTLVTISGNSARGAEGGAVYHNSELELAIGNSTLAKNEGGNINNALGTVRLTGSVVAAATQGADCVGSITSGGYNLDSDGSCALTGEGDLSAVDPLLSPLQDNGGEMLTHALGSGSPAIDAGLPDEECPALDQRYHKREGPCDMGALEAGAEAAQIGMVAFKESSYSVREADGSATITIVRSGGSDGAVSVAYRASSLSVARAGIDFLDFDGVLQWEDGESGEKQFQIQIVQDDVPEKAEPLVILLGNPQGGVALGEVGKTVLNIIDDSVQFGEISFDAPTYSGKEGAGSLELTVIRQNGADGVITVEYATYDKEATAGTDYTASTGRLVFADQESSKRISIPLLDDTAQESDETFVVRLNGVAGGATLGQYTEATITIVDDDGTTNGSQPAESGGEQGGEGRTKASSSGGGGGSLDLFLLLFLLGGLFLLGRSREVSG